MGMLLVVQVDFRLDAGTNVRGKNTNHRHNINLLAWLANIYEPLWS